MKYALIDLHNKARVECESTRAFSLKQTNQQTGTNPKNLELIMSERERKQKQLEITHLKSIILEVEHEERLLKAKLGTLDLKRVQLEGKIAWLEIELDWNEDFSGEIQ